MTAGSQAPLSIFWFRRDLRLDDNAGLFHALRSGHPVLPIFIFDLDILDQLEDRDDARVEFIHHAVRALAKKLSEMGSALEVYHGRPEVVFTALASRYQVHSVYANHDADPYAIERDHRVSSILAEVGSRFVSFKDHLIFEGAEVVKDDGLPYTVFTPYCRKWKAALRDEHMAPYRTGQHYDAFFQMQQPQIPTLQEMGFRPSGISFPPELVNDELIRRYGDLRDLPALPATSRLGVHLRFGTISIRALCRQVLPLSDTYLNELIWREFYHMILFHFPRVGKGYCFKPEYEELPWRNKEDEFQQWTDGKTGFPIVDAGMRELNQTGFMHNRVRMITASFLTKHLLIDWRWGESWFARKLLDFDLAANNGGWQWAAGCGCDAAPYFRVFNPWLQTEKFDPERKYISRWVPEWEAPDYPLPMVDHKMARTRCLATYAAALKKGGVK
jgi:deoxyribodipyrimidine photo-lyase